MVGIHFPNERENRVLVDGVSVLVSAEMLESARAHARLVVRERLIAEQTGLIVFHFRDADDDWGGTLLSTIEREFMYLMIDANPELWELGSRALRPLANRVRQEVA